MGRFAQRVVVVLTFGSAVYAEELSREQQCSATESCGVQEAPEVPVTDISPLVSSVDHSPAEWETAAEAVARACEEWGFFQVCGGQPWRSRISIASLHA